MQSIHTALLPFPHIPLDARQAHVLPALQNKALLSIGQLCNSDFTAVLHKYQVQVSRDDTTITGKRYPRTGLYYIDLPEPPPAPPPARHPFACSTYEINNKAELVQ